MKSYITEQLDEAQRVMSTMLGDEQLISTIESTAKACINCIQNSGKVLLAGNGGSAADATLPLF